MIDAEVLFRKRRLRSEIARSRQNTQVVLAALGKERRRLTSWKTYVQRFPWAALGISFGTGLWLASARPGRRMPRALAAQLIQMGITSARRRVLSDLTSIWAGSQANRNGPGTE